jgi:hypothetical protein
VVAPLFLKHNRRIEALITVICLALLVFCLIERHIRAQIAPQTTIPGLYAGRPARPADWLIFLALAGMRLIPATLDRQGEPLGRAPRIFGAAGTGAQEPACGSVVPGCN